LSRNRERVGGTKQIHADPPVPQATAEGTQESPFSFVVPTSFVDLPSEGRFYAEGHPLHNESTIEIKQMTAKEEDILTSRSLLKKGIALDRVLRNVIIDKRIDVNSLLIGDKNAIVVATRVSGYGNEYITSVTCPACGVNQEFMFDLNECEAKDTTDEAEDAGVIANGDGTFNIALPRTEIDVTFSLMTGREEKRLLKLLESSKHKKDGEQNITQQLKTIIEQVNGDDDPKLISYVVENLPSLDSRYLRNAYKATNPDLDLTQEFTCSECDHEQDMEVPLTADFFWPDR
jgi:hypothetical protein